MSSRKSRGNRNNKTKLIIGAVLLLLLLAVGLYFILNKEEEPEKDTRKTSTTGSSTGSSKTNYVKPPEQDSSTNTEFIKARDKLLALYEDPTKPKLTDTDKTALFKQIEIAESKLQEFRQKYTTIMTENVEMRRSMDSVKNNQTAFLALKNERDTLNAKMQSLLEENQALKNFKEEYEKTRKDMISFNWTYGD